MAIEGCAHAVFARSPHAHARIAAISTARAAAMSGVLAIITGREWAAGGLGTILPCMSPVPFTDGRPMNDAKRPVFATEKVCFVGDTVAAAIAETRAQAADAAEAIAVEYEALPVVTDVARAIEADAPVIHAALGTNVVYVVEHGDAGAAEAAIAGAHHVSALEIRNRRIIANPMETRCYLGHYDEGQDHYTLWASCQGPHQLRVWLSKLAFGIPLRRIRVVAPDVGGGFGPKGYFYPEQPVVLWASKLVGRPVRFTATRSDAMMTDAHARDHVTKARMGFDREGRILGLAVDTIAGFGGYQSSFNAVIPGGHYPTTMSGLYRTPAVHVRVTGAYTNTAPIDAYRGSIQASTSVGERLLENGARELGIEVAEMRARNYIGAVAYPYTNPLGTTYDSGNPAGQQAIMMAAAGYVGLRAEQAALKARGLRMGVGMAGIVEGAGLGPSRQMAAGSITKTGTWEAGRVRVHPDGRATLSVGTHSHGQSHEITFRQVAADGLGIDIEAIDFQQGDTDRDPGNFGTGAARSLSTAGIALAIASQRIVAKATTLAAHLMECAEADIDYRDGVFTIRGTDRGRSFAQVAEMAYRGADYPEEGFELGLESTVNFDPVATNYPTALHLAVVMVDVETGVVGLRGYHCVCQWRSKKGSPRRCNTSERLN